MWCWTALAVFLPWTAPGAPSTNAVPPVIQRNYDTARQKRAAHPDDAQAAWELAHACFDRAEYSRTSSERAKLADEGMAAGKFTIEHAPGLAEGHYYLALNLAQLARTKMWGALPLLGEMERGWLTAATIDDKLDYAGPDRYVGLLYRDAPTWPVSLGDRGKGRSHLLRAVEISPNYPENYLNLIESYFGWEERDKAAAAYEKLRALLPAARREFTGEYWDESWKDWDQRLEKIQSILDSPPGPVSPHRPK